MREQCADDRHRRRVLWDAGFGAVLSVLALIAMLFWFPLDMKGGFLEPNFAGKLEPGDAFFPYLLSATVLLLGLATMANALLRKEQPARHDVEPAGVSGDNIKFLLSFNAIILTGLALMYWMGPIVVAASNILTGEAGTYRQLVDTPPYKFIGYATGGLVTTLALIGWARGNIDRISVLVTVGVMVALVLIFEGVLSNVQLPPNADY